MKLPRSKVMSEGIGKQKLSISWSLFI